MKFKYVKKRIKKYAIIKVTRAMFLCKNLKKFERRYQKDEDGNVSYSICTNYGEVAIISGLDLFVMYHADDEEDYPYVSTQFDKTMKFGDYIVVNEKLEIVEVNSSIREIKESYINY